MKCMKTIYQVGVLAKDCDHSEKPLDHRAYLICGEKKALIDGVPEQYTEEYLQNIEKISPVSEIDYLIFTHTEQAYTGAFSEILKKNPNITVIATVAGLRNLKEQQNAEFCEEVAKNAAVLDLGNGIGLEYLIAPNLDWPDTMLLYCEAKKTVFSADFGSCYSVEKQEEASRTYYEDVLSPFASYVQNALEILEKKPYQQILCGHGEAPEEITAWYRAWSDSKKHEQKQICICYASEYGATKKMAEVLADALTKENCSVCLLDAKKETPERILAELYRSDAWLFGVPTINRKPPACVLEVLHRIEVARASRKVSGVFGSYGWSGEACTVVQHYLEDIRTDFCPKPVRAIFVPEETVFAELLQYAERFLKKIREKSQEL